MRKMTKRSGRVHAPSLQRFSPEDLAPFTKEGTFAADASRDFHLFYVGRDDVHGILKYLLLRATASLYLNMFGYDDEELNAECMRWPSTSSNRIQPSRRARTCPWPRWPPCTRFCTSSSNEGRSRVRGSVASM
jgi:hypothetical protein